MWEATQSNLKKYDIHPKEQLPSGHNSHKLPWRTWRTANRVGSGVRTGCTLAAKHLWGYRASKTYIHVRHCHMRSWPHYDELPTFWGETKQRRHCENGGSSCAMDERHCRHDMMIIVSSQKDNLKSLVQSIL